MEVPKESAIRQNRITVQYVTTSGQKLNQDLNLFGQVGKNYRIKLPNFAGYQLVEQSEPTSGVIPATKQLAIKLTYQRLGRIMIVDGDMQVSQTLTLKTEPGDPTQVLPLELPELPDNQHYYRLNKSRYQEIAAPDAFMPLDMVEDVKLYAFSALDVVLAERTLKNARNAGNNNVAVNSDTAVASKPGPTPVAESKRTVATSAIGPLLAKALVKQVAVVQEYGQLDRKQQQELIAHVRLFLTAIELFSESK